MGYKFLGESKFFLGERLVRPLRVLKWPFIGELAWKRPNCPVGEALQDPCEPMWHLAEPIEAHVVLSALIGWRQNGNCPRFWLSFVCCRLATDT
jgi:hypothetical protein